MDGSNHIRYSTAMPDMKFINSQIPILEVARAMGLEVRGRKATCPECKKKRLTFSVKFNCWRCWNCDPAGKRKTVIDLVMFILNVDAFNAAAWINKRWNVVSQVQMERSENRNGLTKHLYQRVRQIPVPERDKPNLQAIVTSPGWRDMALSARVVAVTLLALARMDANNSVTIDRKGTIRSHRHHGSQHVGPGESRGAGHRPVRDRPRVPDEVRRAAHGLPADLVVPGLPKVANGRVRNA